MFDKIKTEKELDWINLVSKKLKERSEDIYATGKMNPSDVAFTMDVLSILLEAMKL